MLTLPTLGLHNIHSYAQVGLAEREDGRAKTEQTAGERPIFTPVRPLPSTIKQSCAFILLLLGLTACGGASALSPSPVQDAGHAAPLVVALKPIALAGQSNALFLLPFLMRAAAPTAIVGYAQDGSTIAQWADGTPNWLQLAPTLHQPLKAFIWWQGESDAHSLSYPADLVAFLGRVRVEAHDATLRVVLCRVVDDPAFVTLRLQQAAYVQTDAQSVLVSSDGLEREHPEWVSGSAHLSATGYTQMAQRVLAAVGP